MVMKTIQLKDALANNSKVIENIIGIPSGFKTSDIATDNVFILYYRMLDNRPIVIEINKWTSLQNKGEIAAGVVVFDGIKTLVISVMDVSLRWSAKGVNAGGNTVSKRSIALNDFDGELNTTAQITHSECSSVNYASGFCAQYSRVNANGVGLTAGNWWLPSLGELMMIYANMNKINYALSFIDGAAKISETWYWSSTERDVIYAWTLIFSYGLIGYNNKSNESFNVRPVSHIA